MSAAPEPGHDPVTSPLDGYVLVPHERPEDWGWHQEFKVVPRIFGWIAVASLLLMVLFGNHVGRVEDLWVIGVAAVVAAYLVHDRLRRRNAWRD